MALTAFGLRGPDWRLAHHGAGLAGRPGSRLTARLTTCPTRPARRAGRLWRQSPGRSDEREYYVQKYPKAAREDKDNKDYPHQYWVYAKVFAQPPANTPDLPVGSAPIQPFSSTVHAITLHEQLAKTGDRKFAHHQAKVHPYLLLRSMEPGCCRNGRYSCWTALGLSRTRFRS